MSKNIALHLVEQAQHLAQSGGAGRPRQADLRRAISSAYYALFHLLCQEAARMYAVSDLFIQPLARSLDHGELKAVCQEFKSGRLPDYLRSGIASIPPELKNIANAFSSLQEFRHEADYDLSQAASTRITRTFVRSQIIEAHNAIAAWERIKSSDEAKIFLTALLFRSRLLKRK